MRQLKKSFSEMEGLDLALACARVALETKAEDLMLLDVRGLASFTDYFLIMSGRSTRHVQGLAEAIEEEVRSKRANTKHNEGLQDGRWVLLDLGDVVVHVFYHEVRSFYDLEGLWHDAPRIDLKALLPASLFEQEL